MATATIPFRPLDDHTLQVVFDAYGRAGADPARTYGLLLSAAAVAGAILGVTPQQVAHHAPEVMRQARRAVAERPDIFGPGTDDEEAPAHG